MLMPTQALSVPFGCWLESRVGLTCGHVVWRGIGAGLAYLGNFLVRRRGLGDDYKPDKGLLVIPGPRGGLIIPGW